MCNTTVLRLAVGEVDSCPTAWTTASCIRELCGLSLAGSSRRQKNAWGGSETGKERLKVPFARNGYAYTHGLVDRRLDSPAEQSFSGGPSKIRDTWSPGRALSLWPWPWPWPLKLRIVCGRLCVEPVAPSASPLSSRAALLRFHQLNSGPPHYLRCPSLLIERVAAPCCATLVSRRQPLRFATENPHSWLRLLPRRRVNSQARVVLVVLHV